MAVRTIVSILVLAGAASALISCSSPRSAPAENTSTASAAGASCSVLPDQAPPAASTPAPAAAPATALIPGGVPLFGAAPPPGFNKSMGQIADMYGRLMEVEKARWAATNDYPTPAADAGKMAGVFRTLIDGERARSKPAEFAAIMKKSSENAADLQAMLGGSAGVDAKKASALFAVIGASCADCHTKYGN